MQSVTLDTARTVVHDGSERGIAGTRLDANVSILRVELLLVSDTPREGTGTRDNNNNCSVPPSLCTCQSFSLPAPLQCARDTRVIVPLLHPHPFPAFPPALFETKSGEVRRKEGQYNGGV